MTLRAVNPGMSDDQLANERDAQFQLSMLLEETRRRIRTINNFSAVIKIDMGEWEAFVHDSLPDKAQWDEKISAARNP